MQVILRQLLQRMFVRQARGVGEQRRSVDDATVHQLQHLNRTEKRHGVTDKKDVKGVQEKS